MRGSWGWIGTVGALVCGLAYGQAFPSASANPAVADADTFFQSVLIGHMVDACKRHDVRNADTLTAAWQNWLTDRSGRIARGRAYSLEVFKERNTTEQAESDALRDGVHTRFEPQIVADPKKVCAGVLQVIQEANSGTAPAATAVKPAMAVNQVHAAPGSDTPTAGRPNTPAEAARQMEVNVFYRSIQYDVVTRACLKYDAADSARMTDILAQWRAENADAIDRGRRAAPQVNPRYGKTEQEQLAKQHELLSGLDSTIRAEATTTCRRAQSMMQTALPVPMTGTTLTDKPLRFDIYKQAANSLAAMQGCRTFDSVATSVVSDRGTGPHRVVEERWVMNGCGKAVPAFVSYSPGATGGTNFVVRFENASELLRGK